MDSSSSILQIVLRVLFNVPSDITVIGIGVLQPLGSSEVVLTRYTGIAPPVNWFRTEPLKVLQGHITQIIHCL